MIGGVIQVRFMVSDIGRSTVCTYVVCCIRCEGRSADGRSKENVGQNCSILNQEQICACAKCPTADGASYIASALIVNPSLRCG